MLNLHEGTRIESASGEHLGDVDRLVIDPSGRKVTHVVVRKGIFFPDDKVIPIDVIAEANESCVKLRDSVDADELPPFEEMNYVELDRETSSTFGRDDVTSFAWAYPMTPAPTFPRYPVYPPGGRLDVDRNIPDDTAVIEPGTHVVTTDDQEIGKIREVGTDDKGQLSHVVVDPGWLDDERVIPAHWISEIGEEKVRVGVGAQTFRAN